MSNLSSVAVRSRRMSIGLEPGEGSRAPHTPEINASSRSRHTGITLGVSDGSRVKHAEKADRLTTPRTIRLVGSVEGQGVFDGSDNLVIHTEGDYQTLKNKPQINGVTLEGNKSSDEIGVQKAGEYPDSPIPNAQIDEIIDGNVSGDDSGEDTSAMTADDIDHVIG